MRATGLLLNLVIRRVITINIENDNYDRELLKKISESNEKAIHEFFQRHNKAVYAFALKRLNNEADAADILNDVMIQIWQKAHTFEGRSKVKTWVLGITNFKVLDFFRKRSRDQHDELSEQIEDENANSSFVDISLLQDAKAIKLCIDKLSDSHSQVVHLAFFEDMSYPEISQIIECPVGTVKTRMMHAKNSLKRCLQRTIET